LRGSSAINLSKKQLSPKALIGLYLTTYCQKIEVSARPGAI